ncbi:MAG TPA: hypothetical protein VEO56_12905 [Bacteroidota bacterium]|nr:hypothetical protein [Bacteroidota bacterium]
MAYTYEQLNAMTVAQLREIAKGIDHEALQGNSTMHKEKLVPALCVALGIEAHKHHQVAGLDKGKIKLEIRNLKKARDEALTKKDLTKYRQSIREIHHLKNRLRHATR